MNQRRRNNNIDFKAHKVMTFEAGKESVYLQIQLGRQCAHLSKTEISKQNQSRHRRPKPYYQLAVTGVYRRLHPTTGCDIPSMYTRSIQQDRRCSAPKNTSEKPGITQNTFSHNKY
jgi:hypothetical protein